AKRSATAEAPAPALTVSTAKTELKGIDVFVEWSSRNPNSLAEAAGKSAQGGLKLQMIDNRGVKVWPAGMAETFCTDSFRCRFVADAGTDMATCIKLLSAVAQSGIEIAATQMLRTFDGQAGYTRAHGQYLTTYMANPLVVVMMR